MGKPFTPLSGVSKTLGKEITWKTQEQMVGSIKMDLQEVGSGLGLD